MSQPKPFPQINPKNPQTLILLTPLRELSERIMRSPDKKQSEFGVMLNLVANAPIEFDYLYFRVHEGIRDLDNEFRPWYNTHVHSKGQKYMLEVLNREIGSIQPHFNSFQFAFYHINEYSKTNEDWIPLNSILWAIFCSLFDTEKFNRLANRVREIIIDVKNESHASLN